MNPGPLGEQPVCFTADPSLQPRRWGFDSKACLGHSASLRSCCSGQAQFFMLQRGEESRQYWDQINIHGFLRYMVSHLLHWRGEAEGLNELRNLGPDGQTLV